MPFVACRIILISDDAACKTICVVAGKLSSDKSSVYQITQILFRLIHADDAAGSDTDRTGFVVQEPVTGYTLVDCARCSIVSCDTSQISVACHIHLHSSGYYFTASVITEGLYICNCPISRPVHIISIRLQNIFT